MADYIVLFRGTRNFNHNVTNLSCFRAVVFPLCELHLSILPTYLIDWTAGSSEISVISVKLAEK